MRPLFTIHGGEYLFANQLQKQFPTIKIWIPGKDDGVDFLLTDKSFNRPLSIQVKYSKDFNWSHGHKKVKQYLRSASWYSFKASNIRKSKADFWVLVNYDGFQRTTDFLFIPPSELLQKLRALKRTKERIECYVTVTNTDQAFETRSIKTNSLLQIISGELTDDSRNLTVYLNRWDFIKKHFKVQ